MLHKAEAVLALFEVFQMSLTIKGCECVLFLLLASWIFEFAKSRAKRAYVPTWSSASVLACQRGLRVNVPACQKRANFSFLRANVPHGVLMFQIGVPKCQKTCQFFKHSSYEMLLEISILYYHEKILHYTLYYSCTYHMYMKYRT